MYVELYLVYKNHEHDLAGFVNVRGWGGGNKPESSGRLCLSNGIQLERQQVFHNKLFPLNIQIR